MSISSGPQNENDHTYAVPENAIEQEIVRLQKQDQWMSSLAEGALTGPVDPATMDRVLNINCGAGGWLLDMASTYPSMAWLIGVDANARLIRFARNQAQARQLSDRVEFHAMQVRARLEFPEGFFHLINVHTPMHILSMEEWLPFLLECQRICRPGGMLRFVEVPISVLPVAEGGARPW